MWNLAFTPPQVIEAGIWSRLPDAFRAPRRTDWSDATKSGAEIDSFLEGPAFDRAGNLYVTDIPYGRIFRVTPQREWSLVVQYDGWPNGSAIDREGRLWIADFRRGLLRLDPASPMVEAVLGRRDSEAFKGLNDLTFDSAGNLYVTDQGQTGMHDPTGRVYRLRPSGQVDCLLSNAPSPNGITLDRGGKVLFVSVTRANAVWRGPLLTDGSMSKVHAFRTFFGTSGPDGLAIDDENRLVVAHASLGGAFVLNAIGEVTHFVRSPAGRTITNVAFVPGTSRIVLTDSESGSLLTAELPGTGATLYSHA